MRAELDHNLHLVEESYGFVDEDSIDTTIDAAPERMRFVVDSLPRIDLTHDQIDILLANDTSRLSELRITIIDGTNLSDFRRMSKGGMGIIFKCKMERDQEMIEDRIVKFCICTNDDDNADPTKADLVMREASVLEKIKHLDCAYKTRDEKYALLLMREYTGPDMRQIDDVAKETGLNVSSEMHLLIIKMIHRVAVRLKKMATWRLMQHGDIKESNIMFDDNGPMLIDFGVAMHFLEQLDFTSKTKEHSGDHFNPGTFVYMSKAAIDNEPSHLRDIHALLLVANLMAGLAEQNKTGSTIGNMVAIKLDSLNYARVSTREKLSEGDKSFHRFLYEFHTLDKMPTKKRSSKNGLVDVYDEPVLGSTDQNNKYSTIGKKRVALLQKMYPDLSDAEKIFGEKLFTSLQYIIDRSVDIERQLMQDVNDERTIVNKAFGPIKISDAEWHKQATDTDPPIIESSAIIPIEIKGRNYEIHIAKTETVPDSSTGADYLNFQGLTLRVQDKQTSEDVMSGSISLDNQGEQYDGIIKLKWLETAKSAFNAGMPASFRTAIYSKMSEYIKTVRADKPIIHRISLASNFETAPVNISAEPLSDLSQYAQSNGYNRTGESTDFILSGAQLAA